ncbi:hypothetical protein ACVW06_000580 [Pantoea ananatis]
MLVYHPAYDAYHCLFRMMSIIERVDEVEIDKLKMLDFYILFPSLLNLVRMPRQFIKVKKDAERIRNEYHDPLNPVVTFKDMKHIQEAAIKCMLAAGYIDAEFYGEGVVKRSSKIIPLNLKEKMDEFINDREPFSSFIIKKLSKFHLVGPDGLKSRTQLMEYRYDIS